MMLALLGALSSIKHPPKSARFVTLRGDATKVLENRLNQSANPSPLIRAGPAQNVCAWSAHGRRHGARGLIPEGKPCGPDQTQPATGHLDLAVLSLPFPLIPISSRDLNLTSFARVSCIFDSFAVSVAVLPSVLFSFCDFSPPPIPRQFPAHPFISQFLFVHNLFSFPSSVPLV